MKALAILERLKGSTLARNAGWLLVGQGLGLVFQAVYFVVLARLLGKTEYGVLVGAFAFTSLVSIYCSLGSGTVFLRYVSGRPELYPEFFGNILLTTAIMSTLVVAGVCAAARWAVSPASAQLVFLAALANCLFGQLTIEIGRVFQAAERLKITAMLNLGINALRAIAVVVLSQFIHQATAHDWCLIVTSVSGIGATGAVVLALRNFGAPRLDLGLARKYALEGFGFSFAGSTSSIYNDIDKTMLSHYGMNAANGIYAAAYRLLDIATMPIFSLRDAAVPRIFQHGHKSFESAYRYGQKLLKQTAGVGALTSLGLLACAPLVPFVFGKSFAEVVSAVRWLAIIPLFRGIHQSTGAVLTGTGRQLSRTAAQLTAAALNFGMNLYLIPHFGWRGAAWASVITDGGLAAINAAILLFIRVRIGKAPAPDGGSAN